MVETENATHSNVHAADTKDPVLKLACDDYGKLVATAPQFIWQYGEASLADCNYTKMEPSGHQRKITLVVEDGVWVCTTIYNGTN